MLNLLGLLLPAQLCSENSVHSHHELEDLAHRRGSRLILGLLRESNEDVVSQLRSLPVIPEAIDPTRHLAWNGFFIRRHSHPR